MHSDLHAYFTAMDRHPRQTIPSAIKDDSDVDLEARFNTEATHRRSQSQLLPRTQRTPGYSASRSNAPRLNRQFSPGWLKTQRQSSNRVRRGPARATGLQSQ